MTHAQSLFFIGGGLHPCNACFSLVTPNTYTVLAFHWSYLTPMKCFFFHWSRYIPSSCLLFIGHSLQPYNACFLLAIVYTLTMLVLHWSQPISTHCLFSSNQFDNFIYVWMDLAMKSAMFIADQDDISQMFVFLVCPCLGFHRRLWLMSLFFYFTSSAPHILLVWLKWSIGWKVNNCKIAATRIRSKQHMYAIKHRNQTKPNLIFNEMGWRESAAQIQIFNFVHHI